MDAVKGYIILVAVLSVCTVAIADYRKGSNVKTNELFMTSDADKDGQLSRDEFLSERNKDFQLADQNGDGILSRDEFRALLSAMHSQSVESAQVAGDTLHESHS